MGRIYAGYIDTVYMDTLVNHKLTALGSAPTLTDMLSLHGQFSMIRPLLFIFALTYAILPPLLGYLWAVTRPSVWVYQYLGPWFHVNFLSLFSDRIGSDLTPIRTQHMDEYGKDLRCFWPRIWWYTLPLNTIILIYASNP